MLQVNFPQQSNQADWADTIQFLSEDDGLPLWTTPPSDLVITLTVKNETRRGMGDVQIPFLAQQTMGPTPVIEVVSTDSSGQLTVYDDGYVEYDIPASVMSNLVGGYYEVFVKMQTAGRTTTVIRGLLPLVWGG